LKSTLFAILTNHWLIVSIWFEIILSLAKFIYDKKELLSTASVLLL